MIALRIIGLADGRPTTVDGLYVKAVDVDGREGRGEVYGTEALDDAIKFADVAEALEFWKRESAVVPVRPDGKPNRPLTAYTVETVPL